MDGPHARRHRWTYSWLLLPGIIAIVILGFADQPGVSLCLPGQKVIVAILISPNCNTNGHHLHFSSLSNRRETAGVHRGAM